ncbi:MAG: type II toxin-antitoxin system prevent-host-death family antitoxin [Bifidobacteriaceae bacterium]|jgi:prevent-host-death family protein|nr:type II toxin-antitoxin system prevent-host-death family antitoxin [Bifidobacteriaceae bacterium]
MTASVGIRELRQNPAAAVAAANAGEIVLVTDRGTPVAQLVPAATTRREQMIAAGKLRPAVADYRELPPPRRLARKDGRRPSEALAAMREAERW